MKLDAHDVLALRAFVGFCALEYGIAQFSTAAAWMTGGAVVMIAAIVPMLRKAAR